MSGAQITLFRKRNGILSKHISLRDGKANVDNKHCYMKKGEARRVELNGIASLGQLLESMRSHEALALGRLRSHLPDRVRIVTKDNVDDETADDVVARSGAYLHFAPNQPAYMLLDHDRKGTPREVAGKLAAAGGFWSTFVQVIPALAGAAYVQRASTSAWLFNRDTREWLPGSKGEHIYIQVADGSDIERATKTLHQRLWLAGFGYHVVGTIGQLLSRSIIDAAVWGAERLVFEGQARVGAAGRTVGPQAAPAGARRGGNRQRGGDRRSHRRRARAAGRLTSSIGDTTQRAGGGTAAGMGARVRRATRAIGAAGGAHRRAGGAVHTGHRV